MVTKQPRIVRRQRALVAATALIISLGVLAGGRAKLPPSEELPDRLSDREFWRLSQEFSEPNGYFRSDNLLSNEAWMQYVIPELVEKTKPGGAYLGVGPEQNFTYIAAVKPRIAFITDIRRGNLHAQLMYKALFELSADRADFLSLLFTRRRPEGLDAKSTVEDLVEAFGVVPTGNEDAFAKNLKAVQDHLVKRHKLPLPAGDLEGIEYVYRSFYSYGPEINYRSTGRGFGGRRFLTYADVLTLTDANGVSQGFLANEENFKIVKNLEEKNLIVPVVGDFAGPKALRAVGAYLRDHDTKVTAFYLSNVEQYLGSGWYRFCASVASMPLDDSSTFIRSSRNGGGLRRYYGGGLMSSLGNMQAETRDCKGN